MWERLIEWEMPDFLVVIFFGIVAFWEFYRWKKESKRAKKQTLRDIADERKFRVIRKLWEAIVQLKQSAFMLTPNLGIGFPDYKNRLKEANEAWKNVYSIAENNKPFYPSKIYDLYKKLSRDCMQHLILVTQEIKAGSLRESFDSNEELAEKGKLIIQEIEQTMREETA